MIFPPWALLGLVAGAAEPKDGPVVLPLWRAAPEAPRVLVEVGLPDGRPALFVVDTGSDVTVLPRSVVLRLGLPLTTHTVRMAGLHEVTDQDGAVLPQLHLGKLALRDLPVAVVDDALLPFAGPVPVSGILGADVWQRFAVDLDLSADRVVLSPPGSSRAPRRSAPLVVDGGHLLTPVQLVPTADPGSPIATLALLDTASTGLVLRGAGFAAPSDVTEALEPVRGLGTAGHEAPLRTTRRFAVSEVRVAGERLAVDLQARWVAWDVPAGELGPLRVRGIVGQGALHGRRVVLDPDAGRVWLARPGREAWNDALAWAEAHVDHDPLARASLALARGRNADALALCAAAQSDRELPAPTRARAALVRASLLVASGDHPGSAAVLGDVPPEDLARDDLVIEAVDALLAHGLLTQAAAVIDAAVRLDLPPTTLAIARAESLLAAGDEDAAASALATPGADALPGWALRRARIALAQGDPDSAVVVLRDATRRDPTDGRALWSYALLAARVAPALLGADLARLEEAVQPDWRPLDALAGAWRLAGDPQRASELAALGRSRDCARRAPGPDRDNCQAWYLAMEGRDSARALALVAAALASGGAAAAPLDTQAELLAQAGRLSEAAEAARGASRLAPSDPYHLLQAARLAAQASGTAYEAPR